MRKKTQYLMNTLKGGKLHFHAPIGALAGIYLGFNNDYFKTAISYLKCKEKVIMKVVLQEKSYFSGKKSEWQKRQKPVLNKKNSQFWPNDKIMNVCISSYH